jgi:hypothetical protein
MAATARAVDLTNVKEGGNFRPRRKPEGDYKAKIVKADDHLKDGKEPGWVLTIMVHGDARSTYPYYLSSEEKQAWKIRGICIAAGINVKTARIKFDPNRLVGREIGIALEDDEYNGRERSSIADVFTVAEVGANADEDAPEGDEEIDLDDAPEEEPEEEEEEPAPPVRKRRAKPEPEPEPEEEEEYEEEEPPPPPRRRRAKPAPEPEPEDDEEEEEEEAPAPPPRRRRATTPPTKAVASARRKPAPPADDDDDLDDLDTDDL